MKKCSNKITNLKYNFLINNSEESKNNIYNFIKSIMNIPVMVVGDKIKYIDNNYMYEINKNDVLLSRESDKTMLDVIDYEIFSNNFTIETKSI